MAASVMTLLETFQLLSSFSPPNRSLKAAPWEAYVDWAIAQGLGPLAAYNLEYRLTGAEAPEWAKDRLLSIYQGTLNDNVMKMVNFKRAVDELEGHRILLLGGANFAEAVYPHVAFRPVLDIRLWVRPETVEPLQKVLSASHFKPDTRVEDETGAHLVLSDGRTPIFIHTHLLGENRAADEGAFFERAMPMRVYGPSFFRPQLEDALLLAVLEQARAGFEVPTLTFVDVRELLLGAPSLGGPYSRPMDAERLLKRAHVLRLERALFTSLSIVRNLFPETKEAVEGALPSLRAPTRALLTRMVIAPTSNLGQMRSVRGASRLRQLLSGV